MQAEAFTKADAFETLRNIHFGRASLCNIPLAVLAEAYARGLLHVCKMEECCMGGRVRPRIGYASKSRKRHLSYTRTLHNPDLRFHGWCESSRTIRIQVFQPSTLENPFPLLHPLQPLTLALPSLVQNALIAYPTFLTLASIQRHSRQRFHRLHHRFHIAAAVCRVTKPPVSFVLGSDFLSSRFCAARGEKGVAVQRWD